MIAGLPEGGFVPDSDEVSPTSLRPFRTYVGSLCKKFSLAIAAAIFMLASLTACIGDWASEEVDELIEDAQEDVFGTPTPQSGGVPAPPGRSAPPDSSGATAPKIEPAADSGPTVTPQSTVEDAEGGSGAGADGTSASFTSISAGALHSCGVETGDTVVCWGANEAVVTSCEVAAPAPGSASADCVEDSITSSLVRFDQATPPAGYFTSVSAGALHTLRGRDQRLSDLLGEQ